MKRLITTGVLIGALPFLAVAQGADVENVWTECATIHYAGFRIGMVFR